MEDDGGAFVQFKVQDVDPETNTAFYKPNERPGHPVRKMQYDYLVVVLGNRLTYDAIDGFSELAHWLKENKTGDESTIYLSTPAEVIAEDAGESILDK